MKTSKSVYSWAKETHKYRENKAKQSFHALNGCYDLLNAVYAIFDLHYAFDTLF